MTWTVLSPTRATILWNTKMQGVHFISSFILRLWNVSVRNKNFKKTLKDYLKKHVQTINEQCLLLILPLIKWKLLVILGEIMKVDCCSNYSFLGVSLNPSYKFAYFIEKMSSKLMFIILCATTTDYTILT